MSEERVHEICKAFASGMSAAQIAEVEGLPTAQVELIINDNPSKVSQDGGFHGRNGVGRMMNGIDVSKWQGSKIDWAKVKAAGIDYAILRAGYGSYISQKDPTFERDYAECKRLGIPVGVYWYVYAKTLDGIKQEVKTLLEAIKGKQFEYPIYLDIENEAQASMTKAALTQMIETGCTALEQAGYFAGVYTYTSFASYMDYAGLAKNLHYVAGRLPQNYNTTLTRDMHQYTSTGNVAGIGGRVDCEPGLCGLPRAH